MRGLLVTLFFSLLLSASAFAGSFAAIAYSPDTGKWGEYHGASCREEAEREALNYCNDPSCDIMDSGQNVYIALATADGGGYGWASSSESLQSAKDKALRECESRNSGCELAVWSWAFED